MSQAQADPLVILHALGWGVLHSVWIGSILVAIAAVALRALSGLAPAARYGVLLGVLLVAAALPWLVGTHMYLEYVEHLDWVERNVQVPESPAASGSASPSLLSKHRGMYAPPIGGRYARGVGLTSAGAAVLWALFVGSRLIALARDGLAGRRALKTPGELDEPRWVATFEQLVGRMGVRRDVRLLASTGVAVPMVAGVRQPAILVPASLCETLTAPHIEAVLAHELAHVCRRDLITNLVQRLAETATMFPGRTWLSHRIDEERECASDARACKSTTSSRAVYVDALVMLEASRTGSLHLGLGGQGELLRRVERLTKMQAPRPGVLAVATVCTVIVVFAALVGQHGAKRIVRSTLDVAMEHDLAGRDVGAHVDQDNGTAN